MLAYSTLRFWWLGYLENHTNPQEKPSQNSSKLRNKVKLHDFTQQRIVERGMGLELRRKQTRNDSVIHWYTSESTLQNKNSQMRAGNSQSDKQKHLYN